MKKILCALLGMLLAGTSWSATLPAGYTELEYIESTGTQYIDTGVIANTDKFKFVSSISPQTTADTVMYGMMATDNGYPGITLGTLGKWRYGNTTIQSISPAFSVGNVYNSELSWKKIVINGTTYTTDNTTNWDNNLNYSIYLFARNARGTVGSFASARIYYFKIYNNNDLVRNFVPAKNSSGVIGMYDTVGNRFYTNQGTGEFTAGPVVSIRIATTAYNSARFSPVVTELNDTIATIRSVVTNTINQTKAIADLQTTKQTRPDETCPAGKKCLLVEDDAGQPHWYEIIENAYGLPAGYTALEYIQSTGTQYIDTGVLVNTNYSVEAKMNIQNTGYAFYGDDTNYTAIKKFTLFIATTSGTSGWGDGTGSSVHSGMGITKNVDFVVKQDKTGIFINDVKKVNFTPSSSLVSSDYRFYLFRGNHEGYETLGQSKIYYFKMYENDILVRNFVPARRNSDSVLGMYDTVSGTFFTNAGTGTFVAGQEL